MTMPANRSHASAPSAPTATPGAGPAPSHVEPQAALHAGSPAPKRAADASEPPVSIGGAASMSAAPASGSGAPRGRRIRITHERVLAMLLACEIVLFAIIGSNFLTLANAGEIVRASAEVGLLALALTPVILTGGIDLSVGSLLGLSAVIFGVTWKDGGWPIAAAG